MFVQWKQHNKSVQNYKAYQKTFGTFTGPCFRHWLISKPKNKLFHAKIISYLEYRIEEAEREFRYLLLLYFLNWCIATVTCIRKLSFVHVAFLRAQKLNFRNESAFNWKLCKRQTSELLNHFQLMLLGVSIAETKTVKISKFLHQVYL